MGEGSDYPIWDGWFSVAEPFNKFVHWVCLGIICLVRIITIARLAPFLPFSASAIAGQVVWLIIGVVGCILYLIMCMKPIGDKDLNKKMHIFLIVVTVLVYLGSYWAGLVMTVQFVMVGILSDVPFWESFSE